MSRQGNITRYYQVNYKIKSVSRDTWIQRISREWYPTFCGWQPERNCLVQTWGIQVKPALQYIHFAFSEKVFRSKKSLICLPGKSMTVIMDLVWTAMALIIEDSTTLIYIELKGLWVIRITSRGLIVELVRSLRGWARQLPKTFNSETRTLSGLKNLK